MLSCVLCYICISSHAACLPGHAIVASFMVDKPASFLEDYVLQLEDDIFEEISFLTTKVCLATLLLTAVLFRLICFSFLTICLNLFLFILIVYL